MIGACPSGSSPNVHGNLPALRAVLDVLVAERVDGYLCAGDLVGYGAQPNECVELVAELRATCVAGNHDLMATGRLDDDGIGPLARDTLGWTAAALEPFARAYLSELPLTAVAHHLLVAHGSVADPRIRVRTGAQAAGELELLARADPGLSLLIVGHTHRPLAYGERRGRRLVGPRGMLAVPAAERHLLNPGAVGQARERRVLARCLVLDLDRRHVRFRAVPYDQAACERALAAQGLPPGTYRLMPTPLHRRARRYARRVVGSRSGRRRGASAPEVECPGMSDGEASFVLEQFRVAEPGRLEVQGTWEAVNGVDLDRALLVLHVEDRVDQVEAEVVRRSIRGWHAEFAWNGDPTAIRQAALEVGGSLVVEIGPQPSPSNAARHGDGNIVAVHAALAAAQDRLAEAEEEIDEAREEARRARADAERERTRRRHEAERLHEAIESLQQVADEALGAERARLRAKADELEAAHQALARAEAAVAESARAAERYRDDAGAARARIGDLEQVVARTGSEVKQLRQELEHAEQLARRTAQELERADEQALENRRLRETVGGLEEALVEARNAGDAAGADAAALRERLIVIRDALGDED